MPEPPDFEQIAARLDREFRAVIQSQESDQSRDLIALRLRQVWNASGAADLAKFTPRAEDPVCDAQCHMWARTPGVPHEPPGYVADDATCQCGRFRYSQQLELLQGQPSISVGTFVPADQQSPGESLFSCGDLERAVRSLDR